jgi:hypothetical protein
MPNNGVMVRAVFESRHRLGEATFNLSGQMALANLPSGATDVSSRVSVNVTTLHEMQIPWTGQMNTPIGGDRLDFWDFEANSTWTVWWYGTNTSILPEPQTRTFGNVSLTIEYTYMVN